MTPFVGFAPDLPQNTEGVFQDCENIIPTARGFRPSGTPLDAGIGTLSEDANQLAVMEKIDGTTRTFVGTASTIQEIVSGAYTDRSVGGGYSGTDRWDFAVYGNYILATNDSEPLQVSTTGAFSNLTAPTGKFVAVSQGYIMMANISEDETGAAETDGQDKWYVTNDHTDWAADAYNEKVNARLVGGGAITGLIGLGGGFVIFKKDTMHYGTYVGAPLVFAFNEVAGNIGCPTSHAAVNASDVLYFLGNDDFYAFDGARNVPIGNGIREWFFKDVNKDKLDQVIATYNPYSSNVTWFYPSQNSDEPDTALVYNIRSRKWGKYKQDVQAAAKYFSDGIVIDDVTLADLASLYATIDDMTDAPFDSEYWSALTSSVGVIDNRVLYQMAGIPVDSSITYGIMGDDEQYTIITRVRPRFLLAPESSELEYRYDNDYGDDFTYKTSATLQNAKYDLLHSARWHTFKFNFVGNMEIVGARFSLKPNGVQ